MSESKGTYEYKGKKYEYTKIEDFGYAFIKGEEPPSIIELSVNNHRALIRDTGMSWINGHFEDCFKDVEDALKSSIDIMEKA